MSNKIYKPGRFVGANGIAGNSVSLVDGDFVSKVGGFVVASTAGVGIEGVAAGEQSFASDNQTVAKAKVQYIEADEHTEFKCEISGGTVTQADEGKFYNLTDKDTVDGTTESAVGSYVDTSNAGAAVDAVVKMQLKLVKFISATQGIFVVNK